MTGTQRSNPGKPTAESNATPSDLDIKNSTPKTDNSDDALSERERALNEREAALNDRELALNDPSNRSLARDSRPEDKESFRFNAATGTVNTEVPSHADEGIAMIGLRKPGSTKWEHGPMPVSEWAVYSAKHGL